MKMSGAFGSMCAGIVSMSIAACGSGDGRRRRRQPPRLSALRHRRRQRQTPTAVSADSRTGNRRHRSADDADRGGCTFFPANGRDIPHVFYVLQNPMVCASIKPSDLGFSETVEGLPARAAYVRDQIDGTHVLVCRDNNARAFDIVVDIKNDKARNREAAIALAKQVLAGR